MDTIVNGRCMLSWFSFFTFFLQASTIAPAAFPFCSLYGVSLHRCSEVPEGSSGESERGKQKTSREKKVPQNEKSLGNANSCQVWFHSLLSSLGHFRMSWATDAWVRLCFLFTFQLLSNLKVGVGKDYPKEDFCLSTLKYQYLIHSYTDRRQIDNFIADNFIAGNQAVWSWHWISFTFHITQVTTNQ